VQVAVVDPAKRHSAAKGARLPEPDVVGVRRTSAAARL
jgi:hypothetical protein